MPRHKRVTTCLKEGGSISKHCTCAHCTLCVCSTCEAYEGGLTTDCPGERISFDRQKEVHETSLDYTDERGWHQNTEGVKAPRFEAKLSVTPPPNDPRMVVAPSINWTAIDHLADLQHELTKKAIAWAIADRICEDRSAILARLEDEADQLRGKPELDATDRDLLGKLEEEKINFKIACRDVERCDDEYKQMARRILALLESQSFRK